MQFEKRDVSRAVEECNEGLRNILNADSNSYIFRLKQFFSKVDKNLVLNYILKPYLDLKLDDSKFGFINPQRPRCNFVLPEDDDEEISLVLQLLNDMKDNDRSIISIPHSLYLRQHINDNVDLFNSNIIAPAFNKLERKLRYKVEDLQLIKENIIDSSKITIIHVGNITATNSAIGIGESINQTVTNNVFDDIRKELERKIENPDKKILVMKLLSEMESAQNDKKSFKNKYNNFITQLGMYITIISPFLPQLAALL